MARALTLRPVDLHWLKSIEDPTLDLCAHAAVDFRIGDHVLVALDAGVWTVSAAALYLLRTLSSAHTKRSPVAEHLFPCCGFGMYDLADREDVVISGCPSGVDLGVQHARGAVVIEEASGRTHEVPQRVWTRAVCDFSDAVNAFYVASAPRRPGPDDVAGFHKFMNEWARRRQAAGV